MIYIIMCGGVYPAWERPRQLLEIHNEPIVARTIRLLEEAGVDKSQIYISSNDPVFEEFAPVLYHNNRYVTNIKDTNNNGYWTDCFYPTDEPACYIFGDVVFSPEAIKKIVNTPTDDIQFFASAPPFDERYTKPWAEPFAYKVVKQGHFRACIRLCETMAKQGAFRRKPIAWELWQVVTCCKPNVIDYKSYVAINDYTCDVDSADDLRKIEPFVPYTVGTETVDYGG